MSYDSWKLRSDMDDETMKGNGRRVLAMHTPHSTTCAGPCVPCALDDNTVAVSTQSLNGIRCCEHHFACEGCGFLHHTDDAHRHLGADYCGPCYFALDEVIAGQADEARADARRGK